MLIIVVIKNILAIVLDLQYDIPEEGCKIQQPKYCEHDSQDEHIIVIIPHLKYSNINNERRLESTTAETL